jgi:hypothetical protein
MRKRLHILTTVNAKNISRKEGMITIRDVVPIVEDIVMNSKLYPADEVQKAFNSLEQVPAPAGHPTDSEGNFISAKSGEALSKAYIGAYVHNARHADGVTYCDISVNEAQANAMEKGRELIAKLDAAMNGEAIEPIHVSTGLYLNEVKSNGISKGKQYNGIATNIVYDHLAILLDQVGAATPSDGVGMFLNSEGAQEEVETVTLETNQSNGLVNIKEMLLNVLALFDKPIESVDNIGAVNEGDTAEQPQTNSEESQMKEQILAALNAAGVGVEGLTDAQVLAAYNSVITKPTAEKLAAANAKIAEVEQAEQAKLQTEVNQLADKLATNSSLTADDFKQMKVERLRELASNAQAAPIMLGNQSSGEKSTYVLPD